MLKKEDVEGWNKVFADCQIKQGDLTQPTEGFLVRALVCYIRRFGYKVDPPFPLNTDTVENTRENRLFLLRLVRQIEHFLKITDKSYSFNYYDLIRPTPKKTAHTLYILLNYLFYYNMYKEEVFKMAHEPIRKFQDINAAIERTRRDNATKIQQSQELNNEIENLDSELSMLQRESKEISKRTDNHKENKHKLSEQCEKLERSVKHLQEQKRILTRNIVSDDEARELNKQIDFLKAEFDKFKINEGSSVDKLREMEGSVSVLQKAIQELEKASEIIPMRLLEQMHESKKQVEEAARGKHNAEQRKTILLLDIEEESQNQKVLTETYQKEKEELLLKQKTQMKSLEQLKSQLEQKDVLAIAMQEEENELEKEVKEQRDIAEYLKENINDILAAYGT